MSEVMKIEIALEKWQEIVEEMQRKDDKIKELEIANDYLNKQIEEYNSKFTKDK